MNTGITRLVSARLKTRVVEDLLVLENELAFNFVTFARFQTILKDEAPSAYKTKLSLEMWDELQKVFHHASLFILVLNDLLEGTVFREKQRRGDYNHFTTSSSERKLE